MSFSTSKTPAITPRQTMRGHIGTVRHVVHLPSGRQIITCSLDASLRLWDLKSGTQIGEDWRDENSGGWYMALSPNGEIVASGCIDGKVILWDIETRKVIARWTGHTDVVEALCWSADGERVASGSWDGTASVWDVKTGNNILTIKTRHKWVHAVTYSPDSSKLATGGRDEHAVKIWDAKTGELLNTLKHGNTVRSLAWTSDGKKLISGSYRLIRIFDTATWQQIAVLEGHTFFVDAISLSSDNRLLASASSDKTARLWNLDTNLPVGPPLRHENILLTAALAPDGKVLATGCENHNAYTWDVHAILKEAGLEDLLPPTPNVPSQKPLMNSNATQRPPIQARRIPQGFFDGVQNGAQSSTARGTHSRPRSTQAPLLERFASLFHPSHADGAIELQQRPTRSVFSRRPPIVEVPAVRDKQSLFVARRPERDKATQTQQQQSQSHGQGSSATPHAPGTNAATPGARPTHSRFVQLLAHLVLFLCCTSAQRASANSQPTQIQLQGQAQTHATSSQTQHHQGQPQGPPQAQASSSQTQPTAPSTSTTPTAPDAHTTVPGAASVQPRPLPLRTRFVLFLCCASLPHADGH
ncbi:WD40 repeat-like protein [Suillus brevipes Sb2]|nr:WD40 repeat-like protein [Suillus brevipes Sb2]